MKRLAIIVTHPIQYYAPLFRLITSRHKVLLRVFYSLGEPSITRHDPGFGKAFEWDLDLLSGYDYQWVKNTSNHDGYEFKSVVNPDIIDDINAFKPDALLVFSWSYNGHLKVLRHFKGRVPIFMRGDSTLLDERRGLKSIARWICLSLVFRFIDYAFYTGANNKAYYRKFGLNNSQLFFAPHAVDNTRFSDSRADEALALRNSLGISDNEVVILYAGKLENKKNPLLLLTAFKKLERSQTRLLFVGNGHLEKELKDAAAAHSNIHFLDFQNQSYMPVVYQACDLFCLPSQGPAETWGLAVNEAMACGKAVLLSSKVGCAIDLVKKDSNGMIFKSNNEADLVNCLNVLTADKELLRKYGLQSSNIIKLWSFENIATAIEETMSVVLS